MERTRDVVPRRRRPRPPAPTPVVICHGGPGAAHDYIEPIADLEPLRPRVRPLRPARLRQERAPARRARRVLDAAALQGRARRAHASPRHRRPARRRRPVVGRDARDGVRARSSARPARDRRRRLAGEHDALGVRGEPPAARAAPDVQETLTRHEAERHDGRSGVRGRSPRLLRPPHVPRAVARLRAAELRPDGRRPDRLPHDERAERVPRRRLAQDAGTSPTGCTRSTCRRCSCRAATTRRRR